LDNAVPCPQQRREKRRALTRVRKEKAIGVDGCGKKRAFVTRFIFGQL
jgi:hypothetical protein